MNTLLTNIKAVLVASRDGGGSLSYMPEQSIQKVAPQTIPPLTNDKLPFIGIAPVSSPETWYTTGHREVVHTVELYCVRYHTIQEDSIELLTDFVVDVLDVVRNEKFSDYLSAPCTPGVPGYITSPYGDDIYLIVATIQLECRRIFISSA